MISERDIVLPRIADRWFYLGYGEPYPRWEFFPAGAVYGEGYYIFNTAGRFDRDSRLLPAYCVFRVQQDPVFGWYFKEVKL
jgi:hypothetical protein